MDKKRIQHLGLAAVLSIAMLGTTVPVTVLAATPTGTAAESEEAQAPSSKEEAEAAKNEAQKRLDASEKAYKDAQAKKDAAEKAQKEKQQEYDRLQTELKSAETKADDAFRDAVAEKENALQQSNEKLQTAKEELTKAQINLDQAKANCDKAKTDYEDSLDAIATAKQNLEQAKKEKTDAEASVKNAQTEMTAAQAKYEQDLQKAKENLEAAQTAYDNVGINFLNSVISNDSYKIANWKKLLANSSDDKVKNAYEETTFNEAFSVDNLIRVATLLDTCNNYRKSDNNFTEANNRVSMKLSPELVVSATASAMISRNQEGHVLFNTGDNEINRINFPNATNWSENLARGYQDPFDGWYTEEKEIFDSKEKSGTGHYTNIMGDYGSAPMTGIGISYGSTDYRVAYCQRFTNRAVGKTYTSQEWRNAVNSFASDAKSKLDQATATKEKIEAKDSSAVKYYTDAETALQNAKSDLAEKEKAVTAGEQAVTDKTNASQNLKTQMDAANKSVTDAETAVSEKEELQQKAQDAKDAAQKDYDRAKAIDRDNPETYRDAFPDLVQAVQAVTDKKADVSQAKDALDTAVKEMEAAESSLQDVRKTYEEDKAAFEEAKKAYEDIVKAESPLEIRKVVLSKTLLTYNGKVQKPSVKVYDENGTQITEGFKVSYPSGCKNLGSYKVTVTGTDNYKGTVTASYVIRPAKCKTPSVKAGKKKMIVKWKKLGGGSQTYQIYVLKKGTKKAKYYTSTKTSKTIKKLAKKKTYSVKIRSYKKISGKTYYGAWSGTKKVKIK